MLNIYFIYIEELGVYLQALDKAYTITSPTTTTAKSGAGQKKEKGVGQPLAAEAIDMTAIDRLLSEALPFIVRYDIYLIICTIPVYISITIMYCKCV